jgi:hypothetical protein
VGGANSIVVAARLGKAQLAVDREANLGSVCVFLAVVFPPADGAQAQRVGRLQRFMAATGTSETCYDTLHKRIDDVAA